MAKQKAFKIPGLLGGQQSASLTQYLEMVEAKRASEAPVTAGTDNSSDPQELASEVNPGLSSDPVSSTPTEQPQQPDSDQDSVPERVAPAEEGQVNSTAATEKQAGEMYKILYITEDTQPISTEETTAPFFTKKESEISSTNKSNQPLQAVLVAKRSGGRAGKSSCDLLESIRNLPLVYSSKEFQKGEMKVRINPRIADTLRLLTEIIPPDEKPDFLIENIINELLRVYLLKHKTDISELNKLRLQREQQRGEFTL